MSELLSTPAAARLVAALFHFLWQGTILCLLYPLAVNLNLLRTPRARYRFGLSVFCLMALCPVLSFWLLEPVSSQQVFSAASPADMEIPDPPFANAGTGTFGSIWFSPQVVLTCWTMGVVCLSLRLLGGYRQLRRWRLETVDPQLPLLSQIATLCERIGLTRIPEVKLSVYVTEAMAVGFWKPVILLPVAWATELPVSTLEAVIAHELSHIRRFDLWINLGQRFVETMLFYHPAVWWLSNRIREERELCCDELAAQTTGECLGYALALEGVARYLAGSHTLLGTSFLGDGKMKLLKRVRHVLGQSSSTKRKLWWPAGVMALMLPIGIYGTSLTAQDPPREPDRPRADREEGRRDGDRERPREGDRDRERPRDGDRPRAEGNRPPRDGDRPPREGDRPRDGARRPGPPRDGEGPPRDGDRPRPPRDGDRPPRDGDRPRPPRGGDGPPPGDRVRGERDLYREIELLREEVRQLRQELQRRRPLPPPREGFGPPRDGVRPPGGPLGRPRDGEGPPREGFGPPRDREGPPREGDRPRGEGDRPRPPREGDGPPREGDRPRPPREGDRPQGDRPPREGDRPRGEGDRPRPPREGDGPPREADRPRPPREGDRPQSDRPPREGDRPRGEDDRPRPPREGERPPGEGDRPRPERPDRPERPEPDVPAK